MTTPCPVHYESRYVSRRRAQGEDRGSIAGPKPTPKKMPDQSVAAKIAVDSPQIGKINRQMRGDRLRPIHDFRDRWIKGTGAKEEICYHDRRYAASGVSGSSHSKGFPPGGTIEQKHLTPCSFIGDQNIQAPCPERSKQCGNFVFTAGDCNDRFNPSQIVKREADYASVKICRHRLAVKVEVTARNVTHGSFGLELVDHRAIEKPGRYDRCVVRDFSNADHRPRG